MHNLEVKGQGHAMLACDWLIERSKGTRSRSWVRLSSNEVNDLYGTRSRSCDWLSSKERTFTINDESVICFITGNLLARLSISKVSSGVEMTTSLMMPRSSSKDSTPRLATCIKSKDEVFKIKIHKRSAWWI